MFADASAAGLQNDDDESLKRLVVVLVADLEWCHFVSDGVREECAVTLNSLNMIPW